MLINFMDCITKEIIFQHDMMVVPRESESIQYKYFDKDTREIVNVRYRILSVNHLLINQGTSNLHQIICLVTDNDTFLNMKFHKII